MHTLPAPLVDAAEVSEATRNLAHAARRADGLSPRCPGAFSGRTDYSAVGSRLSGFHRAADSP